MNERFRAEVSPVTVSQTKAGRYVFRGVASTVGNVDRMHRVFLPGAFGTAKVRVPLLVNHDENQVLGSSTLTPQGGKLVHESSINPKAGKADEMISLLDDGDIASTSISWLSDQRFYGWNDLKRQNPDLAKLAASQGVAQSEDAVYFGHAQIVENSVVPIPANDRALIRIGAALDGAEGAYVDSMLEVASMAPQQMEIESAAGSRHNSADRASIQTAHDALVNLGATCTINDNNSETMLGDAADAAADRDELNKPGPPLGGWTKAINPHAALEGAEGTEDDNVLHLNDTNQPVPLPAELAELDRELAELAGRFTASAT